MTDEFVTIRRRRLKRATHQTATNVLNDRFLHINVRWRNDEKLKKCSNLRIFGT